MKKDSKYLPVKAFILIYIFLVIIGYAALILPGAAARPLTDVEALFTTISAVTLSGLQVCDFAGIFTSQGQIIVLALIQLGAITAVSFSLYFGWLLGRASLFTDSEDLLNPGIKPFNAWLKIFKQTCIYLFVFELACSGILYAFWNGDITFTTSQKLHYAFFHGVSVFCHSGFSNLEGNFSNPHVSHSYLLLLAVTGVIVLGSIGYAATFDLISIKRLRERMLNPKKNWTLQTRIALYATLILITCGSICWFLAEQNDALKDQKLIEAAFTSIFNIAGARGAGFYSVNIGSFSPWLINIYMLLMIIGVSASSPGGGIKTSFLSPNCWRIFRYIGNAFTLGAIIVFGLSYFILQITDPIHSTREIVFEIISASTNTGLSYGITATLSLTGKYVIMGDMILGRIGIPVTLYLF